MKNKCIIYLIVLSLVALCFFPVQIQANKTNIKKQSKGFIQTQIDNANPGDTVFIPSGYYKELIRIEKPIKLVGEDKYTTFIDSEESFLIDVITVFADNVEISGFTILNASIDWASSAIGLYSNNNVVYDNILTDCSNGIFIGRHGDRSEGNTIKDNIIYNNQRGLYFLYSKDTMVKDCDIYSNSYRGITIWVATEITLHSNHIHHNQWGVMIDDADGDILIDNCDISDNSDSGIWAHDPGKNNIIRNNILNNNGGDGIFLDSRYADIFNVIENNHIEGNERYGIKLQLTEKNDITKNDFVRNTCGIYLVGSYRNNIMGNNFTENIQAGIDATTDYECSKENKIYYNNFFKNGVNAKDKYQNIWYSTGDKGNYWDDYTGEDLDEDGIGDTPYDIPGGSNVDMLPLMDPYSGKAKSKHCTIFDLITLLLFQNMQKLGCCLHL